MNSTKLISIIVIFICCSLKVLGFPIILFLLTSILIVMLTVLSILLSTSTDKTIRDVIYSESSNPLDDNFCKKILGLRCELSVLITLKIS